LIFFVKFYLKISIYPSNSLIGNDTEDGKPYLMQYSARTNAGLPRRSSPERRRAGRGVARQSEDGNLQKRRMCFVDFFLAEQPSLIYILTGKINKIKEQCDAQFSHN
jgi:hypothetical protein